MTFAFIAKRRGIWPVARRCYGPGASRSGFASWLSRRLSDRAIRDANLVAAIDRRFKAGDRTCRARRIRRDVLEEGLACLLRRIERLMRPKAMRARSTRRGTSGDQGERLIIAENVLARDIDASRPNRKRLADSTGFRTTGGGLHVTALPDARRVNGSPDRLLFRLALMMSGRLIDVGGPGCLMGHGRAYDGGLATGLRHPA